ncbi:MAG: 16S rRNA (cytidine(1402)-2'-O)-methyltransferase [Ruminococcaceae bacterium]|nr:16S rRNA (cytidine(1402)-2'-O)-methyltransferase [Oscillospiraceae bacterium]
MREYSLYLVGTPIGNLEDISRRALSVLSEVDFIAAEDTRNTLKLLNRFEIKKPLISYHEHNRAMREEQIIQRLLEGEKCALVSDAGMPVISDPGCDLVKACIKNDISYTVIPGPSAGITALCMSGLDAIRFCFEGFLPTQSSERKARFFELSKESRTSIFYEAPHRLKKTLEEMYTFLGNRKIYIARELTKLYEQGISTTLKEAIEYYEQNEPKGEFVLVLEGCKQEEAPQIDIKKEFEKLVENGYSKSDAVKEISLKYGLKKNEVYSVCIG